MRIVIAGAGIGGLTAALCLKKAGHEVFLCEKNERLLDNGAGLQLGANALHVFDYLGLLPRLQQVAVAPEHIHFRHYKSGDTLYRMRLGARYRTEYGHPYWHVHRPDLQAILIEALSAYPDQNIHYGAAVESVLEQDSEVRVKLSNGTSLEADLLVGADGIRSTVRRLVAADSQAKFTGNTAWRATVPVSALPSNIIDDGASNFVGPNKHAVIYAVADRTLLNFVGVVENPTWREESWTAKGEKKHLEQDFHGWHSTISELIAAIPEHQCYRWALYDHAPMSNWSSQRITLLGDAAHATLPFMASGAALAIEDARILQRALSQADSVNSALQLYQHHRIPRTRKVQNTSARFGNIYHINNNLVRRVAFAGIRLLGPRKERFLPSYNANTVQL